MSFLTRTISKARIILLSTVPRLIAAKVTSSKKLLYRTHPIPKKRNRRKEEMCTERAKNRSAQKKQFTFNVPNINKKENSERRNIHFNHPIAIKETACKRNNLY